jgi:hypothetical protein
VAFDADAGVGADACAVDDDDVADGAVVEVPSTGSDSQADSAQRAAEVTRIDRGRCVIMVFRFHISCDVWLGS